jgi:hypothetical protein
MMRLLIVALVGCGSSPSPAPVDPAPPPATPSGNVEISDHALPLVDAWAEVLGGRDAIAKLGTVHMKGECTIGGRACSFESFMSPRGEVRYAVTFADGESFVSGFDGATGWIRRGDSITDATGNDLDDLLRPSFFESYSQFFADRRSGSIDRDGATSLAITPKGVATPAIVRFRSDGLPISVEISGFRVVFKAWSEYLGVQIVQAWTSGPTGAEDSFRLSSVDDQQGTYAKPAAP